jgi:transposase InsO family protein
MSEEAKNNEQTPNANEGKGGAINQKSNKAACGKRYSTAFKQECLGQLTQGMRKTAMEKAKGVSTVTLRRWEKQANKNSSANSTDTRPAKRPRAQDDASASGEARQKPSRAPQDNIAGLSESEINEILKLKKEHASRGPAQIRAQLKRFMGWRISPKAIARVLKANGYRTEHRGAREEQALQRFEAPHPNALWMMDALQFRVHSERLYLHLIIDDFSRFIVGHSVSEELSSEEAVAALKEAISLHGKPERMLTDRGGQFMAVRADTTFKRFLERELIDHSVSRPYHPQTLGKVESVNRAIQKELLYLREFQSKDETRAAIAAWVERYNFHRAHLGIDGLLPADRYFGLKKRAMAEVQARSRGRAPSLDGGLQSPLDELSGAMEVLKLMVVDGRLQLRFCGLATDLPPMKG